MATATPISATAVQKFVVLHLFFILSFYQFFPLFPYPAWCGASHKLASELDWRGLTMWRRANDRERAISQRPGWGCATAPPPLRWRCRPMPAHAAAKVAARRPDEPRLIIQPGACLAAAWLLPLAGRQPSYQCGPAWPCPARPLKAGAGDKCLGSTTTVGLLALRRLPPIFPMAALAAARAYWAPRTALPNDSAE